ncbi:hypothetical protein E3N88_16054 [Mikania micrantha]|uniref:Uncharacterized protein n=1 Tax=Mikania micrantha TaxID=192012 RepID=A0A5N6NXC7_9ASTR|nr:hypothetical protein E3N88_16054 [Mikania micrantha]
MAEEKDGDFGEGGVVEGVLLAEPGSDTILSYLQRGFEVLCEKRFTGFQGAATTCYLALNPKVKGVTGEYFSDCNLAKPSIRCDDQELAKELWDFSLGLTSSK